jgi:L-amino acid N-acyltransferase YncA
VPAPRSPARPTASPRPSRPPRSRHGQLRSRQDRAVLEPLAAGDWPEAARIYEAGIAGGNATFEAHAPSWEAFAAKCAGYPALAAHGEDGAVIGWAALAPVSARAVYRGVGAVSVYVAPEQAGRGVGRTLLEGLAERAEQAGVWTLEAGIFPENRASIALHERCGFRHVGVRERIGQMPDGRWRDVCLLERRSALAGV